MTSKPKHTGPLSFAYQRQLIKMAETMDLKAIAKKTGRSPAFILKMAVRLGFLKACNEAGRAKSPEAAFEESSLALKSKNGVAA